MIGTWQSYFSFENASRALATGNVALALSIHREIQKLTGSVHQLYVQGGLNVKLDVLTTLHDKGPESAGQLALERKTFFKSRVPLYYLDALAASAWIEKRTNDRYSSETEEELKVFEASGALGNGLFFRPRASLVRTLFASVCAERDSLVAY